VEDMRATLQAKLGLKRTERAHPAEQAADVCTLRALREKR
jgi:hypothetical protein